MSEEGKAVDAACRGGEWEIFDAEFEGRPVEFHHGNVDVADVNRPISGHAVASFDSDRGEHVILRPAFPARHLPGAHVSIERFDADHDTYEGTCVYENLRFPVRVPRHVLPTIPPAFIARRGFPLFLDLEPVAASHLEAVALATGEWDRLLLEERDVPVKLIARRAYSPYGYDARLRDGTAVGLPDSTVKALSPAIAALQPHQEITAWVRLCSGGRVEITRLHDDLKPTLARKEGEEYYAEVVKVTDKNVTLAVWDSEYRNAIFVSGFRSLFREAGVFELARPAAQLGCVPRMKLEAEIEAQECALRKNSRATVSLLKVSVVRNGIYVNVEEILAPRGTARPKAGEERFGVSATCDGEPKSADAVLFEVNDPSVGIFEVSLSSKTYLARAKDETVVSAITPILARSDKLCANLNLSAFARKGGRCSWGVKMVNWIQAE